MGHAACVKMIERVSLSFACACETPRSHILPLPSFGPQLLLGLAEHSLARAGAGRWFLRPARARENSRGQRPLEKGLPPSDPVRAA